MNPSLPRLLLFVLLLAGFHATTSACAIMTKEQDAERSRQIVSEFKAATLALREKADLIFVGRLATMSDMPETRDGPQPHKHQALFDRAYDIKGHYTEGQALAFTDNWNRVYIPVGCRPQFWQMPKQNSTGEYFLVYVQDGIILRTNPAPMDAQTMTGNDEAAFLHGLD